MWRFVARLVFYLIALVTLTWTANLTYAFVSHALPNLGPLVPAFALVVFDGGMIGWLIVFLHAAEGAGQRGISIAGTLFDLVGVGLMAITEVFLGGQTLVAAPEQLGEWALWGIGIWTVSNVALVVFFHLLDPGAMKQMALRDAQDAIQEQAFKQLKTKTSEIAERVADGLSDAMVADTLRGLTAESGRQSGGEDPVEVPRGGADVLALPEAKAAASPSKNGARRAAFNRDDPAPKGQKE